MSETPATPAPARYPPCPACDKPGTVTKVEVAAGSTTIYLTCRRCGEDWTVKKDPSGPAPLFKS